MASALKELVRKVFNREPFRYDDYIVAVLDSEKELKEYFRQANQEDIKHQLGGEEPPIETIWYQNPNTGKYADKYVVIFRGKSYDATKTINVKVADELRARYGDIQMKYLRLPTPSIEELPTIF